jgi:hypothetical protein
MREKSIDSPTRDRALTLVLMAMFLVFLAAQMVTGLYEYNGTSHS